MEYPGMNLTLQSTGTIDRLFKTTRSAQCHRSAPLFNGRDAYLHELVGEGRTRKAVVDTASLLLHVVRVLNLVSPRAVSRFEIKLAAQSWAKEALPHRPSPRKTSADRFYTVAVSFLRFHKLLATADPLASTFDFAFARFQQYVFDKGYLPTTVSTLLGPIKIFLFWASQRRSRLYLISRGDVQDFLKESRARGLRPRSLVNQCQALRAYFQFAESQGWSKSGLSETITNPIVRTADWEIDVPAWKDVRRMISLVGYSRPAECRAKAIILLCALYGLRHSEIRGLTLESFDWESETFAVKRAKQNRWQRFPIHHELGETIIRYLKQGRPSSTCRSLFVTLFPPHRPLVNLATIVTKQMKAANVQCRTYVECPA
jgi:integrase/recombinase XerD